jgi:hypothetical protein
VEEFVSTLEKQRASLAAELEDTGAGDESFFLTTYFPDLLEMREFLGSLKAALMEMRVKQQRFTAWYQQAGMLEGEYKRLRSV